MIAKAQKADSLKGEQEVLNRLLIDHRVLVDLIEAARLTQPLPGIPITFDHHLVYIGADRTKFVCHFSEDGRIIDLSVAWKEPAPR